MPKTGLFITKKRYGLRIINDAGRKCDKIHVKGLDTVRSNFAVAMKELLSNVLEDILGQMFLKNKQMKESVSSKEICYMLHYDVMQCKSNWCKGYW